MAETVFTNAFLSINGVDLSDHVRQITLSYSAELQDKTAMGDDTRANLAGLKDYTVTVEFNQDYAASEIDATLFSLVGGAQFAVVMRPDAGAVSSDNPQYTANMVLPTYQPMGGTVGEMHISPAELRPGSTGQTLTRATS